MFWCFLPGFISGARHVVKIFNERSGPRIVDSAITAKVMLHFLTYKLVQIFISEEYNKHLFASA